MTIETEADEKASEEDFKKWTALALVYGWNELAKTAEDLRSRLFFRVARGVAEKEYISLGGQVVIQEKEEPLLKLMVEDHAPSIKLYPRDMDLIRKLVADTDAAPKEP
jgi:hypothetical protein